MRLFNCVGSLVRTLMRYADHECIELCLADRNGCYSVYLTGPYEAACIEPSCGAPHAKVRIPANMTADSALS